MRYVLGLFAALVLALALTSTAQISTGIGVAVNQISQAKFQRVTTGSINTGVSAVVTLTWATPYTDTNYTVMCSVEDVTAATASLSVIHVESKLVGSVGVRVSNASGGSLTGLLDCIGIHD